MKNIKSTAVIDFSHTHRPTTGIERVALELFSPEYMPVETVDYIRAKGIWGMIWVQWVWLPLLSLYSRKCWFICPGFPPSLPLSFVGGKKIIPYIHDLFLIERKDDLNSKARYYMRPSFEYAVHHCRHFLVNSEYTLGQLKKYCRKDAKIILLRPPVRDVFQLNGVNNLDENCDCAIKLVTIGTIEPRKNLRCAAAIRHELTLQTGRDVELHIIGRLGWGDDAEFLKNQPNVKLHGYCTTEKIRQILMDTDVFISTSKEEGLGLPLLEVQHGGLLVAASDIPVYREVLGDSGCLIPIDNVTLCAEIIAKQLSKMGWKKRAQQTSIQNVTRWNEKARSDMLLFKTWFTTNT